jgi:hypothetical protein
MRNLLAFFAAVIIAFAGVGWYLGWYQVERTPAASGKDAVKIEIDRTKIGTDLHKGGEKLQDVIDKTSRSSEQATNAAVTKGDGTKANPN